MGFEAGAGLKANNPRSREEINVIRNSPIISPEFCYKHW
jgi:hypothetical protein